MPRGYRRKDYVEDILDMVKDISDRPLGARLRKEVKQDAREGWSEFYETDEVRLDARYNVAWFSAASEARRPALEAMGENITMNTLYSFNDPADWDRPMFDAATRGDRPVAWNADAEVMATGKDVRAFAALFDADAGDRNFSLKSATKATRQEVREIYEDEFAFYSAEGASIMGMMDVYARGLSAKWDDLNENQRARALDLGQEGEIPGPKLMKKILGAKSFDALFQQSVDRATEAAEPYLPPPQQSQPVTANDDFWDQARDLTLANIEVGLNLQALDLVSYY